jgi:hypothetical protein
MVFALCEAIFLMSIRAIHMTRDPNALEQCVKFLIFIPPQIGLDYKDFSVKQPFNKIFEIIKMLKNLRLMLEQINPGELAIIINEAYVVIGLPNRPLRSEPKH